MQYLNDALSLDGTLSRKERDKRTQLFAFASIGGVLVTLGFLVTIQLHAHHPIYRTGTIINFSGCLLLVGAILCKVRLTTPRVVCLLYLIAVAMFLWDLGSRAVSKIQWPMFVLIIDMLLVMQVPARYSLGLVVVVVVWLVLLSVEESFRFGLFDIPGMAKQEGEYGRLYYKNLHFSCDSPPDCVVARKVRRGRYGTDACGTWLRAA